MGDYMVTIGDMPVSPIVTIYCQTPPYPSEYVLYQNRRTPPFLYTILCSMKPKNTPKTPFRHFFLCIIRMFVTNKCYLDTSLSRCNRVPCGDIVTATIGKLEKTSMATLQERRHSLGLSQSELAQKLKVTARTIKRWEAFDEMPPQAAELFLLLEQVWENEPRSNRRGPPPPGRTARTQKRFHEIEPNTVSYHAYNPETGDEIINLKDPTEVPPEGAPAWVLICDCHLQEPVWVPGHTTRVKFQRVLELPVYNKRYQKALSCPNLPPWLAEPGRMTPYQWQYLREMYDYAEDGTARDWPRWQLLKVPEHLRSLADIAQEKAILARFDEIQARKAAAAKQAGTPFPLPSIDLSSD